MATRSLVGPGLHSQAGKAAPKCVSLMQRASQGKAAWETDGAEAASLAGVPPPEAHSGVGKASESGLGMW